MAAAEYNITISQNADYVRTFQLKSAGTVKNITDFTFYATVKKNYNDTASAVSMTATIEDAVQGQFTIKLTDTQTAALAPGNQVYDIVMEEPSGGTPLGGLKTRLLMGKAFVSQGVS